MNRHNSLLRKGLSGGGGNRTRVPKPFHAGIYVRSSSIWRSYSALFIRVASTNKGTAD